MTRLGRRSAALNWLVWFGALGLLAVAMWTVRERLDKAHVALAFLLVVLGGSAAEGRGLGISLSGAAFLVFNWVFLPPYYTLVIADPLDWLVLLAFLTTGIVAAQLLERQRREAESARQRADEIDRLATLGAETLNAPRAEDAIDAIAAVIRQAMDVTRCAIFLRNGEDALSLAGQSSTTDPGDEHLELLEYTVTHAEAAAERADGTFALLGRTFGPTWHSTADLALGDLSALGIPLAVRGRVVGALRLSSHSPFAITTDQRRVLGALSYYAALGAERVRLAGAEEEAAALRRTDRLKDALLRSVSHDLRTPLTAIKAIANEVWCGGDPMRAITIEQEADRLNELVDDLLDFSQISAGVLPVTMELNTVDEVIGAALARVEAAHGTNRISVQSARADNMLIGTFDLAHTIRALTNLLENAVKYSPEMTPVFLKVAERSGRLQFTVEDHGSGVLPGDEVHIFEPFYRGAGISDSVRGTGLGLSIARQLIEVQGGTLTYARRAGGGSRFIIDLPAALALGAEESGMSAG